MPTIEEVHAAQGAMWDKFSAGWDKWDHVVSATPASADSQPARQRIASKVIDAAAAFRADAQVRLPGTARCVLGTK